MANINGTTIDLMPTDAMREEAQRYRDWKADGRPGGQDAAATRASQILSGDELSPDTVITMSAWFARHEVDKAGEGFSPGEDGYPSPGRVAWAAWGGDPGKSWADARAERIKAAREARQLGHGGRPYPNEHAARLIDPDRFDEFRRETDAGGPGIDFIYGIKAGEPIQIQAVRFDAARYSPNEARDWLTQHDMKPILFEEATARMRTDRGREVMELRELNRQPLRRVASFDYATTDPVDGESRTLSFSFSSEAPVDRWFGIEVLSHQPGAMDMTRLNDGAPLLWNHNPDQVLGVVERAWLEDGRGMATVRFSRSAFAEEKLAEVRDGILRNVSVGYAITDATPLRQEDRDGFLATSWQPHEVSVVSVPADVSVGIGRSLEDDTAAASAASNPTTPNQPMEPTIDIEAVRAQAAADERSRVAGITALCREHQTEDLCQGLIERGASEADAMREVLTAIGKRAKAPQHAAPATSPARPIAGGGDIGLSDKEVRQFSFIRAVRAQMDPTNRAFQEEAGFERECSDAVAKRSGQSPRGLYVPHDVLRRDLQVSTGSAAGDTVFVEGRPGSFIEQLRNRLALTTLGMTTLTGLSGPVAIPRKTGASTAYWLAEGGEPTGSNPTVDQVNMTPKTVGAYVDFTRRLMLQSSLDVETMVRNDLVETLALELDRAGLYGLSSSNEPQGLKLVTGINTVDFAADSPTFAEVVNLETQVNADNADIGAMAYLTNATRYGAFKTTEKASGTAQFILEPGGTVNGYPTVRSNQVAAGDVFFGVWNQMILGLWSGIDLTVDTAALAKSGGVRVIALQDADFAVRHPEAFCRGNNTL